MVVTEATAIAGIVILITVNLISLGLALRKSGRKDGLDEGKVLELISKVNNLPCIKDPNYMVSAGELNGIVRQLSENLKEVTRRLDNWMVSQSR
jgi:hypothetical protein